MVSLCKSPSQFRGIPVQNLFLVWRIVSQHSFRYLVWKLAIEKLQILVKGGSWTHLFKSSKDSGKSQEEILVENSRQSGYVEPL